MPSSSTSWASQLDFSKSRLLSPSFSELPRWRTSSQMSASIIPPPIVQSSYAPQPRESVIPPTVAGERASALEEKQHELEADIQFLLDAQAEGLIRGLESGTAPPSSTGSTTPTAESIGSASVRRTRRPGRQPGLKSARKGIYSTILALSSLKDEEVEELDHQIRNHEARLAQIDAWEKKRTGLQEASAQVASGPNTVRVQRLTQEADSLQAEINEVELKLADMKSRHGKLVKQVAMVENSVQAKAASYTSSLRILEEDVNRFLKIQPDDRPSQPQQRDGKGSVWELQPHRRTLGLAQEHFVEQREISRQARCQHEREKATLDRGAALWKEAVAEISDFEKRLRIETASLRPSSPNLQNQREQGSPGSLRSLLGHMDAVIAALEKKHRLAEEQSWTLLIAAFGAELDALTRGKEILSRVLDAVKDESVIGTGPDDALLEPEAIRTQNDASEPVRKPHKSSVVEDDDGPDPELLFSTQEIDTD